MKTNLIATIALLIALISGENLRIVQSNLMYHFNDIASDQFPYLENSEDILSGKKRIPSNIDMINKNVGHVHAYSEWNGNHLDPHYIGTKLELLVRLQKDLDTLFKNTNDLKRECPNDFISRDDQRSVFDFADNLLKDEISRDHLKINKRNPDDKELEKDLTDFCKFYLENRKDLNQLYDQKFFSKSLFDKMKVNLDKDLNLNQDLEQKQPEDSKTEELHVVGTSININGKCQNKIYYDQCCKDAIKNNFLNKAKIDIENDQLIDAFEAAREIVRVEAEKEKKNEEALTHFKAELLTLAFYELPNFNKLPIYAIMKRVETFAFPKKNEKDEKKFLQCKTALETAMDETVESIKSKIAKIDKELDDQKKDLNESQGKKLVETVKSNLEKKEEKFKARSKEEFYLGIRGRLAILAKLSETPMFWSPRIVNDQQIIPKFTSRYFIRTYGRLLREGIPQYEKKENVFTNPNYPTKPEKPTLSVLFVYDNTKFTESRNLRTVFSISLTEDLTQPINLESPNLVVFFLTEKATNQKFIFISTHYKSKLAGWPCRKKTSSEVYKFVRQIRENNTKPEQRPQQEGEEQWKYDTYEFRDAHIIFMGDLNTDIGKLSLDLNSQIIRYTNQKDSLGKTLSETQKNNLLNQEAVFKPDMTFDVLVKFSQDLLIRLNDVYDIKEVLDASSVRQSKNKELDGLLTEHLDKNGKHQGLSKDFEDELKEVTRLTSFIDKSKVELLEQKNDKNMLIWHELNNFPTQRKIRLIEMDFDNPYYKRVMNNLAYYQNLPANILKFDCLNFLNSGKRFDIAFQTEIEMTVSDGPTYLERFQSINKFVETLNCLRKESERLKSNKQLPDEDKMQQKLVDAYLNFIYNSIFEFYKIDFILLNSKNAFKIHHVHSMEKYHEIIAMGAPNEFMTTDHFLSFVEIEILGNTKEQDYKVLRTDKESDDIKINLKAIEERMMTNFPIDPKVLKAKQPKTAQLKSDLLELFVLNYRGTSNGVNQPKKAII